jgi:pyruvate formate lyase activating enzyme
MLAMSSGYVHSIEIGSLVDGPGVRFVVFLSGCPLRCQYCHNPDTWVCRGSRTDAGEVLAQIGRSSGFLKASAGGVTVSGGEPLAQAEFALEILAGAHAMSLHTALDTSGYLGERASDDELRVVDLVLLDIKSWDPGTYVDLTGVDLAPTLTFAERLARLCIPVWVRFVLVPGLTDAPSNVRGLARYVSALGNVERMEIVPFHQMGRHKWEALGLEYRLRNTPEATEQQVADVRRIFEDSGLPVDEIRMAPCGGKG